MATVMLSQPVPSLSVSDAMQASHNYKYHVCCVCVCVCVCEYTST